MNEAMPTPGTAGDEKTVALALLSRIREIEDSDGSWGGGDVVDVLQAWFSELGIDITAPTPAPGP